VLARHVAVGLYLILADLPFLSCLTATPASAALWRSSDMTKIPGIDSRPVARHNLGPVSDGAAGG
jgi:hypothetical protein